MTIEYFSFGPARFLLVLPSPDLMTPIPRAPLVGEWVHLPYGGNVWTGDGGRLAVSWSPRIELPTTADYNLLLALDGRMASLIKPGDSVIALLRECGNLQYRPSTDAWVGTVTWEWT